MLVNNALAVLGGALMGLANAAASYEMLILGRFLIGAYSGTQGHHGPARCCDLLRHPRPGGWEWAAALRLLFSLLPRADIRAGAHVCGGDRPHSLAGCLGDA